MKKGFTLIELLIVVAIIGILAGVGVPMYNGYMAQAKYNATLANFDIVAEQADMLAFECAKGGKITVLANDGKNGTLKSFVCKNQNTNSISHLIRDHYHYQGFKNPITGYSATWWFGTPAGASLKDKDGYILFDGNPTNQCLVKITTTVPNSGVTETLTHNVPFHGRVNGC